MQDLDVSYARRQAFSTCLFYTNRRMLQRVV